MKVNLPAYEVCTTPSMNKKRNHLIYCGCFRRTSSAGCEKCCFNLVSRGFFMRVWKLWQWVCRVCGTQHRLQGEVSGSWNARVFFCLLGSTSSKAALEQNSRACLYFCRAPAECRWISAFFLSELFNMCIVHGYIPNSCLNTTIVPICKNKNENMSDTSNCRPVAVATVVSKLLGALHFI